MAYRPAPVHPAAFAPAFDARTVPATLAGGTWSGGDLLAAAAAQNPTVAQAGAAYATALAAARAAKAAPGANLTLTAEYANEAPHWGYQAAFDIPLDLGARRDARITTANLQALQAYYDLGEALWSVRNDLDRARAALGAAGIEIALARRSVDLRAERAERMERRVAQGQDARPLALAAQADLTAAHRRLAAAEGRRESAYADLAKALGVSPPAVKAMALAPPSSAPFSLDDLALWRRDAASSRRDVLRAVADYDIADQALRTQVATQYPSLSIGPSYFYDHGVQKFPTSVGLNLPPWDLNRHAIDQAWAARTQAGKALEQAQAAALGQVDSTKAAFDTAWDDLKRNRERDVPLAQRTAQAATRSRMAGESDRVDELAALGAEVDARLALNDAELAAALATVDLEDALRRSFDPAETAAIGAELGKEKAAPSRTAKTGGAR
ncbi:MAG: TolC family protein [Proteobacteria bacterium]|nr:TolC family protein [Pseudomonadota bacterium]